MTWFWRMSTPKKILSESARGWRRNAETNRTWGWLRNRCGEGILYTLNFRCEQQFYDSYLHYAWIGKSCLRHLPISTPPQRNAYLISLTTRSFSHPQEVSVENFQILKNVKDQFYFIWLSFFLNVLIQVLYYIICCLSRDYLYKLLFLRKMDMLRDPLRDKSGHIWQHLVCSLRHNLT